MAVNYDPDGQRFVSDMDSLKRWAQNEPERREAMDICLNKHWAKKASGCFERIENSARWGWAMYPYRAGSTGPPGS